MSNTQQQLGTAFELINQKRMEEAVAIIRPITEQEPNNADAWWLLAYATDNEREARRYLVTLLKINPAYPKARALLDQLNDQYPPRDDELMMMMDLPDEEPPLPSAEPVQAQGFDFDDPFAEDEPAQKAAAPAGGSGKNKRATTSDLDTLFAVGDAPSGGDDFGFGEDEDPFASLLDEDAEAHSKPQKTGSRRRRFAFLLLIPLLLLCVVLALVFGGGGGEEVAPVAADPADLSAVAPEVISPDNAAELEQVRQTIEREAQTAFNPEAQALFAQTANGNALVLRLCGQPTPGLPQTVQEGMNLIALRVGSTPSIQANLAEVGVTVEDCTRSNDTLYRALSPMAAAVTYSQSARDAGALPLFRQSWVVEN
jgi:hypothetical protein